MDHETNINIDFSSFFFLFFLSLSLLDIYLLHTYLPTLLSIPVSAPGVSAAFDLCTHILRHLPIYHTLRYVNKVLPLFLIPYTLSISLFRSYLPTFGIPCMMHHLHTLVSFSEKGRQCGKCILLLKLPKSMNKGNFLSLPPIYPCLQHVYT